MALRDKIVQKVQPMLEPGEQVQAVIVGQTASQWLAMLGLIPFMLTNRYYVVAATDRRIALFEGGRFTLGSPNKLVASLPRTTVIGPASGLWWRTEVAGTTLRIHRRFHQDVARADAAVAP
jgi:hypothetical protein